MTNPPYTLAVDMTKVAISPEHLDGLAAEYYGVVLAHAGGPGDEMVIQFRDLVHPIFRSRIDGMECLAGMRAALSSYRKP